MRGGESTRQVLGHGSAMNVNENTMVVWRSEGNVEMMENLCTRSEVFFLKDRWLNGYLHCDNNECLGTKHTNEMLKTYTIKKGVRFCVRVRCAYVVYKSRRRIAQVEGELARNFVHCATGSLEEKDGLHRCNVVSAHVSKAPVVFPQPQNHKKIKLFCGLLARVIANRQIQAHCFVVIGQCDAVPCDSFTVDLEM